MVDYWQVRTLACEISPKYAHEIELDLLEVPRKIVEENCTICFILSTAEESGVGLTYSWMAT